MSYTKYQGTQKNLTQDSSVTTETWIGSREEMETMAETAVTDVLLFIDNIFRFIQAGSEVSTLLGRMPSAVGYQPTLSNDLGELEERIASTKNGSVTSVQAIYVPADDLTDPAPATTFSHLDACSIAAFAISTGL